MSDVGEEFENFFESILHSLLPFEGVAFEKRPKKPGDVDFFIYSGGKIIMAIELKNWKGKPFDSEIEREILPRFKNTPKYITKLVIGSPELTDEQIKRYLKKNQIQLIRTEFQLLPRQFSNDPEDLFHEKRKFLRKRLIENILLLIAFHTGKYPKDHVSDTMVRIMGPREVHFISNGSYKTLKFNAKRGKVVHDPYSLMSQFVKIGEKLLDVARLDFSARVAILRIPSNYYVESDNVDFLIPEDLGKRLPNRNLQMQAPPTSDEDAEEIRRSARASGIKINSRKSNKMLGKQNILDGMHMMKPFLNMWSGDSARRFVTRWLCVYRSNK